jgi:hypothetical protein
VRVFKTSQFVRNAQCQRVTDSELWEAITRVEDPSLDLDLGHGLIRRRILRSPTRRRRGYCTILACRGQSLSIVLYTFPQHRSDDLSHRELSAYQDLALYLLNLEQEAITLLTTKGKLLEVRHHEKL